MSSAHSHTLRRHKFLRQRQTCRGNNDEVSLLIKLNRAQVLPQTDSEIICFIHRGTIKPEDGKKKFVIFTQISNLLNPSVEAALPSRVREKSQLAFDARTQHGCFNIDCIIHFVDSGFAREAQKVYGFCRSVQ